MLTTKKYSIEEIIGKLREMEKLTGQGMTVSQAAKRLGITDQTFYRWLNRYGSRNGEESKRLQILEHENIRLKRIIAEQALDISMLKASTRENCEPGPED